MRTKASATAVLFAALALTACATATDAPASPSPTPTQSAATPSRTPSPTPTAEASAVVPQACLDYVPSTPSDTSPVGLAGATATLPAGVVLNPGFQVIPSTKDPGNVEVIARVCSGGIDRTELIEVGNSIAQTIYADPSHDTVTLLMVSSYVPTGEYLDKQPDLEVIQTDYELFLWGPDVENLGSHWE